MGVKRSNGRWLAHAALALVTVAASAAAFGQTPTIQPPPPPPPDTTTQVEKPEDVPPPPEQVPPSEPVTPAPTKPNAPEQKGPDHVPPDASGFHLSTLETKNLSLLYIDPVQTYRDSSYRARCAQTRPGKQSLGGGIV